MAEKGRTVVKIEGDKFKINGEFSYAGRVWNGISIEGLLLNARLVQGIFDDKNERTVSRWSYPDSGKWDPNRNTREFVEAMARWKEHGLLGFTINLQGGSPEGYSKEQPWVNSAFLEDGSLDGDYFRRLESILDRADELGMVVILGYFYFGQDGVIGEEEGVIDAARNATNWLVERGYRNVLIEVNNECDVGAYTHEILTPERVPELIGLVRSIGADLDLSVSASFAGGKVPTEGVLREGDFVLVHGNGVEDPAQIEAMVEQIREKDGYGGQPIVFNEDDHFDFGKAENNFLTAVRNGASWGYFDPGENNYKDGYQCPPVNWGINTERKGGFFDLLRDVTGY